MKCLFKVVPQMSSQNFDLINRDPSLIIATMQKDQFQLRKFPFRCRCRYPIRSVRSSGRDELKCTHGKTCLLLLSSGYILPTFFNAIGSSSVYPAAHTSVSVPTKPPAGLSTYPLSSDTARLHRLIWPSTEVRYWTYLGK